MSYSLPDYHRSLTTFDLTWCVLHLSCRCCLSSTNLSLQFLKKNKKKVTRATVPAAVCSHRDTEKRRAKEKDVFCSNSVLSVLWGSLGQFFCPQCPFPTVLLTALEAERRRRHLLPVSSPFSPICGAWCCKPDQRSTLVTFSYPTFLSASRLALTSPTARLFPYLSLSLSPCLCRPFRCDQLGLNARLLSPTCCPPCCLHGVCPHQWKR